MNQVLCKESDVSKVNSVLHMAVKDYTGYMKKEAGVVKNVKVRCSTPNDVSAQPLI